MMRKKKVFCLETGQWLGPHPAMLDYIHLNIPNAAPFFFLQPTQYSIKLTFLDFLMSSFVLWLPGDFAQNYWQDIRKL